VSCCSFASDRLLEGGGLNIHPNPNGVYFAAYTVHLQRTV
jgi:hypothetical protein